MLKSVKYLVPATQINMDGIFVKQALPTNKIDQCDPFLLLHHGTFKFTDRAPAIHQGIGPHPHRGFSPVTFVINGEVHHRDSRYNNQIAKKGEVQWMHAGAGIIHSERPSQDLVEQNGSQEILQLWINSPAKSKMNQPQYQHFQESRFPIVLSSDRLIRNKLIAGSYKSQRGPIKTESELCILWATAEAKGEESYKIPENFNVMIYLINGDISISGYGKVSSQSLIIFEATGSEIQLKANTPSQYLVLSGQPINEKLVRSGPYVMNSQTEILEAMRDYQMGKMGILIEEN